MILSSILVYFYTIFPFSYSIYCLINLYMVIVKRILIYFLFVIWAELLYASSINDNPAKYVDPFIGTSNSGHTHPGAQLPWGMVSIVPQNVDYTLPGYFATCYKWGEKRFYGFSQTNLSGVGCRDMGSILILPFIGEPNLADLTEGFDYNNEYATPGYYKVELNKKCVRAEVTATRRSGMLQFTYLQDFRQGVYVNLGRSLSKYHDAVIYIVNDSTIEGYKLDGGFGNRAAERRTYFSIIFNKKAEQIKFFKKDKFLPSSEIRVADKNLGVCLDFGSSKTPLLIKTGISYVSIENARLNREIENEDWNFLQVQDNAYDEWNKTLSRIRVSEEDRDNLVKFYTGLYHVLIHPNIISDVNGEYPLMGERQGIGINKNRPRYSVFSLWDTYRNVHPLLTLIYPEIQSHMLASMVDMYKENGWLPKWEIVSHESFTMVGDPAIPVIVDSYIKGIRDFDYNLAYEAMIKHATSNPSYNIIRPGLDVYMKYGYIPQDDRGRQKVWGTLSTSLEYYYADWNIAQMAKVLGKSSDYQYFLKRSKGYVNFWNPYTKFLQPKLQNGNFMKDLNPIDVSGELGWPGSGAKGYVEGNAWQYSWFVPHDMYSLVKLYGGDNEFVDRLQECFDKKYFVLSNEPDMAYPYLFNYVNGGKERTQKQVVKCISENYRVYPGGIPGNDDTGTLSAWLVFSMLGFYPDCPGSPNYAIGIPSFDEISIDLNGGYYSGKTISIKKIGASNSSYYSCHINGKDEDSNFVSHNSLISGCSMYFKGK